MKDLMNYPSAAMTSESVAVIGNYLPRKCGIATFTSDLVKAISARSPETDCWAVAMNDKPEKYNYPKKVRFEIDQHKLVDYRLAAEFLNIHQVDAVCLQHEFGIFGGPAGSHVLELLEELSAPVVTTLHTVLTEPEKQYRSVMMRLARLSDRLVVMSHRAVDILHSVYNIPRHKISYIPHGIPDMPFADSNYYKEHFGLLGRKVLLTFGLLSPNKGIEYVIQGLPKVVERIPDLHYVVLGATHPHIKETEGERYRQKLKNMVQELGLEDNVEFKNQFVTQEELCNYLLATDLYVTPYVNKAQITSGTLAYAMGTGKAVISTPYWYAEEMLGEDRGMLVPFRDSGALAEAINELLENDIQRHQIRKNAYDFSRKATWKQVAQCYTEVFNEVRSERNRRPQPFLSENDTSADSFSYSELPAFKLDHMLSLTDDTGILQHATYTVANRSHGYCTDDNARALVVAAQAKSILKINPVRMNDLCNRYLGFLHHAFNPATGRFRNFMSYDRRWLEDIGSEDAHGRALWGLGMAVELLDRKEQLHLASKLFQEAATAAGIFTSPRAVAFSIIGIHSYLQTFSGDTETRRILNKLADWLYAKFEENSTEEWPWLEDKITYANGKLPHALLLAGHLTKNNDMIKTGLNALDWLLDIQTETGHLSPIGNQGWFVKDGVKARFDQQPLEAHSLVEASIAAYHITKDQRWLDRMLLCFNWFLGKNDLNLPLFDARSGGCRDGLESNNANQNQGAESTLAWLQSLQALYQLSAEDILQQTSLNASAKAAIGG